MALRDWSKVRERIELHLEVRHFVWAFVGVAGLCAGSYWAGTQGHVERLAASHDGGRVATEAELSRVQRGSPRPARTTVTKQYDRKPPVVPRRVDAFGRLRSAMHGSELEQIAVRSAAADGAAGLAAATVRCEPRWPIGQSACGFADEDQPCEPADLFATGFVTADGRANGTLNVIPGLSRSDAGLREICDEGIDVVRLQDIALAAQRTQHELAVAAIQRKLAWMTKEFTRRRLAAQLAVGDAAAAEGHIAELEMQARKTMRQVAQAQDALAEATKRRDLANLAAESAEKQRRDAKLADLQRVAQAKEQQRIAQAKEQQRIAQAKEQQRIAQAKEQQRIAQAKEQRRGAQAKEQQRIAQAKEQQRIAQAKEQQRVAQAKEQQRIAQAKEQQRIAQAKEQRRLAAQRAAPAKVPTTRPAAPATPKTPNAVEGRAFYVQIKSFKSATDAQAFARELAKTGHKTAITRAVVSAHVYYRVRLGPFPTRTEAAARKTRFEAQTGATQTMVMSN